MAPVRKILSDVGEPSELPPADALDRTVLPIPEPPRPTYTQLAAWEASVAGPFDRWPTRQGFDKFYGFLGGETNQWAPFIYDGTHPVELPDDPNYHFLTDMTDQTVAWIKLQKALVPGKPFFVSYAPGATHEPHHVPKDWIARW